MLNRYPLVVCAALQMDCSGGYIYTDTQTLLTNMAKLTTISLAAAERELEQMTGEQITWFALGGKHTDVPCPHTELTGGAPQAPNAERVLGALYN